MLTISNITEMLYLSDKFSKAFEVTFKIGTLGESKGKKHRPKPNSLSDSEVMTWVNDELKNICQIAHTRHSCFTHLITNLIAGLSAYGFLPKKPTIRV